MAIIGIDLGTTNSACGVFSNDGVKLIPNRLGDLLTPSVVGLDDSGHLVVGRLAKERLIQHSDRTVGAFKRMMGSRHQIKIGKQLFTATELSSFVLRSLKEDAETYLGEPVSEAVISVPAYFSDNQRQATKQAAEIAGLKVMRLINEPTAAAIAYGLNDNQQGTYMILDMGGGTFDVSILEFFEGVMQVHASAGDNFLGGEDFVDAMYEAIVNDLNIDKTAVPAHLEQRILMQLETAKRRVSSEQSQILALDFGSTQCEFNVTPVWFQEVVNPLLLRVKVPVERALRDANQTPSELDDVVLVGGATRMGVFRNAIGRMFGVIPSCHLDPDLVVAMGAAIQAGLIERNEALEDIVLTDVCPYTLGTGVINNGNPTGSDVFLPIIERNTTVPISIEKDISTAADNQTKLLIKVYQGEHRLVERNICLGELTVPVPRGPKGREAAKVRFSYDMSGLLEVDVTVVSTKKTYSTTIEQSPGMLSEQELAKSRDRLAAIKFHPRELEANQMLLARAERMYEASLGDLRDIIGQVLAQFEAVLDRQLPAEIDRARIEFSNTLDSLDREEWF